MAATPQSRSVTPARTQENVGTPSLQALKLRRSILRDAVVVFITAGYSGKRFIFERCKELGVKAVIIDGPDSWSQQLVADGLAVDFIGVDFGEADTLFDRLMETCRKVCPRCASAVAVLARSHADQSCHESQAALPPDSQAGAASRLPSCCPSIVISSVICVTRSPWRAAVKIVKKPAMTGQHRLACLSTLERLVALQH